MEKSDESKIFLLFPRRGIFLGLFICEESSLVEEEKRMASSWGDVCILGRGFWCLLMELPIAGLRA